MQGINNLVMGSEPYPERNGVLLKGFKQWTDRPDICFEKVPPYLSRLSRWERETQVDVYFKDFIAS